MPDYNELLNLIEKHTALFDELAEIQQVKLNAVPEQNTPALEDCMKKEQAHTLALRGFDKKREELQKNLSLGGKTFRDIIPLVPEEFKGPYQMAFAKLTEAYDRYRDTADCAKEMLEVKIYKLGSAISQVREKSGLGEVEVYNPDGIIPTPVPTRKDMKV